MMTLIAHSLAPAAKGAVASPPIDQVALDYDGRFLRRKLLTCRSGRELQVDLPKVTALTQGDHLLTQEGPVEVIAAAEEVLIVTGDLARFAWHIGNRHTPCQIDLFQLVIRKDHVLRAMLVGLGATLREARQAFIPEGGAYGAAQVMGHAYGSSLHHGHPHGPSQGHGQEHDHLHGDGPGQHRHD